MQYSMSVGHFCWVALLAIVVMAFLNHNYQADAQVPGETGIRVVDINKPCSASCNGLGSCGDGESWSTAYKFLQDALDFANSPAGAAVSEIWVADGTYFPDESAACPTGTGNRSATFTFGRPQLRIMGGFNGTEPLTMAGQLLRNPFTYVTILSGDIDQDNTLDNDNSYHVVTALDGRPRGIVDGFTITMGYAVDAPAPPTIDPSNPHVPAGAGGGLISYYFDPTGMGSLPPADPTIVRCTFHTNIARIGGAMFITSAEQGGPEVYNCVFFDNEAQEGGAVFVDDFLALSQPNFYNSLFYDNEATGTGGGAVYCTANANIRLVNCTMTRNTVQSTSTGGGGITNVWRCLRRCRLCQWAA